MSRSGRQGTRERGEGNMKLGCSKWEVARDERKRGKEEEEEEEIGVLNER